MNQSLPYSRSKAGFSLMELSIVVAVMSLMMGGMLNIAAQNIREKKQTELKTKMGAIEDALVAYRKNNNALPCPANQTALITSSTFGVGATAGVCNNASLVINGNIAMGLVPIRSLGLPDEYAFDPWGGRFTYTVDIRMTAANAFTTYGPTSTALGTSITVKTAESGGTTLSSSALALVLSHGQNGHGAYQLSGTQKTFSSTNTDEQKNCRCDASLGTLPFDAIFVQRTESGTGLSVFDDVLRYYTRAHFLSSSEKITEK